MDTEGSVNVSDADRREIHQLVTHINQQNAINAIVHSLTEKCFRKCLTGKIVSDGLSSSEGTCASNCVGRWIDVQTSILKTIAAQGNKRSSGFL